MATLLRSRVARALDDAAEMFVRLTTRMHNRAREALDEHRARQAAETDALFAFRELGRAIRTDFLLLYLGSVELRRAIGAATNKSELFNRHAQWVAFGSSGLATAATCDEQRKMVKYNHLVANL